MDDQIEYLYYKQVHPDDPDRVDIFRQEKDSLFYEVLQKEGFFSSVIGAPTCLKHCSRMWPDEIQQITEDELKLWIMK
jgi:hypothetical protein